MKSTYFFLLMGFSLLSLALSCKHPTDPDPIPGPLVSSTVTSPPSTSLTSTTYTIPASIETAYADVPQPPATCQIIKMTYKGVNLRGPVIAPESVTIDGKTFQVSTQYTVTYQYDSQRRLIWQRRLFSTGQPDSTQYIYSLGQVMAIRVEYSQPAKTYYRDTTTYLVDGRGYPYTRVGVQEVNADGFLLRTGSDDLTRNWITYTIKDLNIVSSSTYVAGGFGITTFTSNYYATRPALPALTPFTGRSSRSLLGQDITSVSGSIYLKDGRKDQENFIYEFDTKGRIKRRVAREVSLSSDWAYEFYTDGIGITDYEYVCL